MAKHLGLEETALGAKRKDGVLSTMTTRRAFLSAPSHRILPKHSSWLNQIEIIFGIINRRVMRHGNFTSKADLIEKLKRFITYFNTTLAKPMNWTDTGRPTRNTIPPRPRTWRQLRKTERTWKKSLLMRRDL